MNDWVDEKLAALRQEATEHKARLNAAEGAIFILEQWRLEAQKRQTHADDPSATPDH